MMNMFSWNAYGSYGEALLKAGQADKAAEVYKRSIELNPDNKGEKKRLKRSWKRKKQMVAGNVMHRMH